MGNFLNKLLANSSAPLGNGNTVFSDNLMRLAGSLAGDLSEMLQERDGFYALESALHVFPVHSHGDEIGLEDWNYDNLWRNSYDDGPVDGCLFFAEDIFGGQFCIKEQAIYLFDPETAGFEYVASNVEGWASAIINDYAALTGYPLAHQWQQANGKLPPGSRLLPKIPFVAGGEFDLDNLYLSDSVEGMKFRAQIANQIKDLPDGSSIKFDFKE